MRWFAGRQRRAPLVVESIDHVDAATLEIVELDGEERLEVSSRSAAAGPREVGYAPRDRDPTSMAGIWEALARS